MCITKVVCISIKILETFTIESIKSELKIKTDGPQNVNFSIFKFSKNYGKIYIFLQIFILYLYLRQLLVRRNGKFLPITKIPPHYGGLNH